MALKALARSFVGWHTSSFLSHLQNMTSSLPSLPSPEERMIPFQLGIEFIADSIHRGQHEGETLFFTPSEVIGASTPTGKNVPVAQKLAAIDWFPLVRTALFMVDAMSMYKGVYGARRPLILELVRFLYIKKTVSDIIKPTPVMDALWDAARLRPEMWRHVVSALGMELQDRSSCLAASLSIDAFYKTYYNTLPLSSNTLSPPTAMSLVCAQHTFTLVIQPDAKKNKKHYDPVYIQVAPNMRVEAVQGLVIALHRLHKLPAENVVLSTRYAVLDLNDTLGEIGIRKTKGGYPCVYLTVHDDDQ